jgi:hypothetical protein
MRKITKTFAALGLSIALVLSGCATEKKKNQAKEAAAKFWQDKAYPGKSHDIQVIDAEKTDDGAWRVKGIVDGETRVGTFNPETENFSEGYYSLAHERNKRIAELEQEVRYWKEKSESLEKENYKLKVRAGMSTGGGSKKKGAAASAEEAPASEE